MAYNSNYELPDYSDFLSKIGYLAVVTNLNGPFARRPYDEKINQFQTVEKAEDVQVGIYAYNGILFGKVSAVVVDPDFVKITVQYVNNHIPAGTQPANHNHIKTEVYHISVETDDSATTQHLSYQKLDNIGVVFVKPVTPDVSQNPDMELDGAEPVITQGGADITLTVLIEEEPAEGASVTVLVDGEPLEDEYVTDENGEATIPNTFLENEEVEFLFTLEGHNNLHIGPITVGAAG